MKEQAVGEKFTREGKELVVVLDTADASGCEVCFFMGKRCLIRQLECRSYCRDDENSVHFEEVK